MFNKVFLWNFILSMFKIVQSVAQMSVWHVVSHNSTEHVKMIFEKKKQDIMHIT